MVGLLHAMAFMVLLLIGWVIWNNKPLPLPIQPNFQKYSKDQTFSENFCGLRPNYFLKRPIFRNSAAKTSIFQHWLKSAGAGKNFQHAKDSSEVPSNRTFSFWQQHKWNACKWSNVQCAVKMNDVWALSQWLPTFCTASHHSNPL